MTFEVNGTYENRKGKYTVMSMNGRKMTVQFEDGSVAELNIGIQERIWENIVAEHQSKAAKSNARKAQGTSAVSHYIKVVSIPPGEDLNPPGWEQKVVMARSAEESKRVKKGDRLIYYAMELQIFFGVATITESAFTADPKKYTYTIDQEEAYFYAIDIDADAGSLAKGVMLDSVELESIPNFGTRKLEDEGFYTVGEDDFELLAEALTEISEDEEDNDDLPDDDYEDEDE